MSLVYLLNKSWILTSPCCAAGLALPGLRGVPRLLLLLQQQRHQQRRLPQQQLPEPGQSRQLPPPWRGPGSTRPSAWNTHRDTATACQVTEENVCVCKVCIQFVFRSRGRFWCGSFAFVWNWTKTCWCITSNKHFKYVFSQGPHQWGPPPACVSQWEGDSRTCECFIQSSLVCCSQSKAPHVGHILIKTSSVLPLLTSLTPPPPPPPPPSLNRRWTALSS